MVALKIAALFAVCVSAVSAVDIEVHAKGEKKIGDIQYGIMHEVLLIGWYYKT